MDKIVAEYILAAVDVIIICFIFSIFIGIYNTCQTASELYQKETELSQQQQLYSQFYQYDGKEITDTEVLHLMAEGVNLPQGIKIYSASGSLLKALPCNEAVNIGNGGVLSDLRKSIPAGTIWRADLISNSINGEIAYIKLIKV